MSKMDGWTKELKTSILPSYYMMPYELLRLCEKWCDVTRRRSMSAQGRRYEVWISGKTVNIGQGSGYPCRSGGDGRVLSLLTTKQYKSKQKRLLSDTPHPFFASRRLKFVTSSMSIFSADGAEQLASVLRECAL